MKTLLRYAGGKSRAIKKITPFVKPYDTIVSPFLGGGSLEVHWASEGKKIIAGDVFDILVNFWNILLNSPDTLADELQKIDPNADKYKEIKEILIKTPEVQSMLDGWQTDFYKREEEPISALKLAAYYYFNHNTSYGPGFLGWPSKIYMDKDKWSKTIGKVKEFSCSNLSVLHQSFEKTIVENKKSFLYLDPPYYTMDIGETRIGKNRQDRTSEQELGKVDQLTTKIEELEAESVKDKKRIALLKTERHEIMKKESHEILIVKRKKNE